MGKTQWYDLLKPALTKFVESFVDPKGQAIKDFWQTIAHYESGGSGPTYLSGECSWTWTLSDDGLMTCDRVDHGVLLLGCEWKTSF